MPEAAPSPRRIVLCLDGTWSSAYDQKKRDDGSTVVKPTNPLKMCRAVLPVDPVGNRIQITYYDTGLGSIAQYPGTSNGLLRFSDRVLGGGWGAGFEGNVEDALHFLAINHEPGDEVYLFGFSRGAATARAVTRFLEWSGGLPAKSDSYYLPRLFRAYVIAHGEAAAFSREMVAIGPLQPFRSVNVRYLGVWDTVMALGSRFESTGKTTSVTGRSFHSGLAPARCVRHARQALAVDETRFDFRPEIWTEKGADQLMEQRWFPGVHANIGGGYVNDGLANIAFRWILEGAKSEGLKVDDDFVRFYRPFPGDSLYRSASWWYRTLDFVRFRSGRGKRVLDANALLDPSVIARMRFDVKDLAPGSDGPPGTPYRPANVIRLLAAQPDVDAYLQRIGISDPERRKLPDDVIKAIERERARAAATLQTTPARSFE